MIDYKLMNQFRNLPSEQMRKIFLTALLRILEIWGWALIPISFMIFLTIGIIAAFRK